MILMIQNDSDFRDFIEPASGAARGQFVHGVLLPG
jgi:hypothetical protein